MDIVTSSFTEIYIHGCALNCKWLLMMNIKIIDFINWCHFESLTVRPATMDSISQQPQWPPDMRIRLCNVHLRWLLISCTCASLSLPPVALYTLRLRFSFVTAFKAKPFDPPCSLWFSDIIWAPKVTPHTHRENMKTGHRKTPGRFKPKTLFAVRWPCWPQHNHATQISIYTKDISI